MSGSQTGRVGVLVVENDREMLKSIRGSLRAHGYRAEQVATGQEALARLRREDFVAVVANLSLARMHDLDLVQEIQRLAGFRPWVMYTGVPEPSAARWRAERGVFCILMKGTPLRDLLWSVEEACRTASRVGQARCA